MQYCSLLYWTLLSPPDISSTAHHFHFVPATSFFSGSISSLLFSSSMLDTFQPEEGGSFFFCLFCFVISFCLFIFSMLFSRKEYFSGLSIPPAMDHVLSEHFTTPVILGWPYTAWLINSFLELHKPFYSNKVLIHEV